MTTEKQQTQTYTTCDGQIGTSGMCNKCGQPAMTTGNSCGRLIPVQPEKQLTPLQKLLQFMKDYPQTYWYDEAKRLLPEEKQMVIDAYGTASNYRFSSNPTEAFKTGEQYFNDTFE